MTDKLTRKEKGFVKEFAKTGNGVQSALKVYDTDSYKTASNIASTNLDKPRIQDALRSIADRIPDELLEKVHIEGLNATKTTKVDETDTIEPDYATRHKYLDTAYKLKKLYGDESQGSVNVIMPVLVKFLDKKNEPTSND